MKTIEQDAGKFTLSDLEVEVDYPREESKKKLVSFREQLESLQRRIESPFSGKSIKYILGLFSENDNLIESSGPIGNLPPGSRTYVPLKYSVKRVIYLNKSANEMREDLSSIILSFNEYSSLGCPELLKANLEIKKNENNE